MDERETAEEIDSAAFGWVARLDRGELDPELNAKLEAWLAGDPRRRGAFLHAEALWSTLDAASLASSPLLAQRSPNRSQGGLGRGWTRRGVFGAAGAAVAAGVAGLVLIDWEQTLSTSVGEVRHLPLADGSTVDMNTQSRVQVAMRPRLRRIRLREGEAWFQVAHNPSRPFVVEANNVRVRAVGTAFSVRLSGDGAEVMVSEGVVEAWVLGAEKEAVRLSANESARIGERARPVQIAVDPAQVDRKLAWREGRIDLDGETVESAVAEFNRYSTRKIRVLSPKLASERVYGVFKISNQADFVNSLHVAFGAKITRDGNFIVLE